MWSERGFWEEFLKKIPGKIEFLEKIPEKNKIPEENSQGKKSWKKNPLNRKNPGKVDKKWWEKKSFFSEKMKGFCGF